MTRQQRRANERAEQKRLKKLLSGHNDFPRRRKKKVIERMKDALKKLGAIGERQA